MIDDNSASIAALGAAMSAAPQSSGHTHAVAIASLDGSGKRRLRILDARGSRRIHCRAACCDRWANPRRIDTIGDESKVCVGNREAAECGIGTMLVRTLH
jgi:hypothetical protein